VEALPGAEARQIDDAIWEDLAQSCRRRQLHTVAL
jgi:hypothetical protein